MDIFSHVLWANLIIPGDPRLIILGTIAPDILVPINWTYRLAMGHGTFWKTKGDFFGLILGRNKYADGYKHVNRGPLYIGALLINSIWGVMLNFLIFPRTFALAFALHVLIDVFTHKGSEEWQPFYPLSTFRLKVGIVRWGLDLNWYILINFVFLGILYLYKFING